MTTGPNIRRIPPVLHSVPTTPASDASDGTSLALALRANERRFARCLRLGGEHCERTNKRVDEAPDRKRCQTPFPDLKVIPTQSNPLTFRTSGNEYLTVELRRPSSAARCLLSLSAQETPENRLECVIACNTRVSTPSGNSVSTGRLRILCGSGLAFARRQLQLNGGLSVNVTALDGVVEIEDEVDEVGVCHATAIAVARALGRSDVSLRESLEDWMIIE